MNMKKIAIGLLAALALSSASAVYADNNTEFGVEDDLTVLGTGGNAADPDAEIKGFTVFGAAQSAPALIIPVAAGNIFANGYVQVSSGMYVAGSSTFAAGAYFTGISSFAAGPGSIYVLGGAANQVLKKVAGAGMVWADDLSGAGAISGTPNRVQKIAASGTGLVDSVFVQSGDGDTAGITMLGSSLTVNSVATFKSSVTINGNGTDGLGVAGAAKFDDAVTLGATAGDAITVKGAATAEQGLSITGGDLGVTNNATVGGTLTANGNTTLGNAASDWIVAKSSVTVDINGGAIDDTAAFAVKGTDLSGRYAAKFYSGSNLAAWIRKK